MIFGAGRRVWVKPSLAYTFRGKRCTGCLFTFSATNSGVKDVRAPAIERPPRWGASRCEILPFYLSMKYNFVSSKSQDSLLGAVERVKIVNLIGANWRTRHSRGHRGLAVGCGLYFCKIWRKLTC